MDKSDDACIDIKSSATYLRGRLGNLYPLSEDCCIYRVPSNSRNLKGSHNTPQIVSIGPLHYGREELRDMEEYKLRYSKQFLQRTQDSIDRSESLMQEEGYGSLCEDDHFMCIANYHLDIKIETIRTPTLPTITELHRLGVKFEVGSNKHLFDIRFDKIKGILEIPMLAISEVSFYFKNLQMFEALHCVTNQVNDYAMFLSLLVRSPKDVELLIQNGILKNTESLDASTFCAEIGKQARWSYNSFHYIDLVRDLNVYCKSRWHKWKANWLEWNAILKQNYFNNPWASISVIAAVLLLLLTITQTVCSIIAL
ncbi:hypothetical protein LWI29_018418 [Acer saccharum]|uniref:Uncharacterized protein n=1 Tax=Acer saccharum TaxID=4024 RepID=A0AA39VPZ1_ACESA|nr:hypothetical protein LWI29_018418 [Acer saccharum]